MDRNTELKSMPAPPLGSAKDPNNTWCQASAVSSTPAQNEKNSLKEYSPPAPTIGKKGAMKG